jgi:hypothetical protein
VLITIDASCILFTSEICVNKCALRGILCSHHPEERAYRELVTPLEARRQKYLKRRHEHGDRSEDVRTANSGIYSAGTP